MTKIIFSFLKPGGSLLVVDFIKQLEGHQAEAVVAEDFRHIAPHENGFNETEMRNAFEEAGLIDFSFSSATKAIIFEREVELFLARGKRANAE